MQPQLARLFFNSILDLAGPLSSPTAELVNFVKCDPSAFLHTIHQIASFLLSCPNQAAGSLLSCIGQRRRRTGDTIRDGVFRLLCPISDEVEFFPGRIRNAARLRHHTSYSSAYLFGSPIQTRVPRLRQLAVGTSHVHVQIRSRNSAAGLIQFFSDSY